MRTRFVWCAASLALALGGTARDRLQQHCVLSGRSSPPEASARHAVRRWVRNDLRLHDNPCLARILAHKGEAEARRSRDASESFQHIAESTWMHRPSHRALHEITCSAMARPRPVHATPRHSSPRPAHVATRRCCLSFCLTRGSTGARRAAATRRAPSAPSSCTSPSSTCASSCAASAATCSSVWASRRSCCRGWCEIEPRSSRGRDKIET